MFSLSRYREGRRYEYLLKSRIETITGSLAIEIDPTSRYDYSSATTLVELKTRTPRYSPTMPVWFLNSKKSQAYDPARRLLFFYYFISDDSLWYLQYDESKFRQYPKKEWEANINWQIPATDWVAVPREVSLIADPSVLPFSDRLPEHIQDIVA